MDDKILSEIKKRLKRDLNELEKHIFEAMWSEHCGYLHSKLQLKKLNFKGALLPFENAGGIKIDDLGIFFKVESHNHPCAIEPYQGAATGIGGIIRDILALNARPVALLNSLKFCASQKHLIDGVTRGISDYGNSCGIANIGGEVIFDECYRDLPLVNVMAVGIAPVKNIKLSGAKENLEIVLLGSATGMDGVGGAAFASKELSEEKNEEKIHVQIGDPFEKKKLIEATLEILSLKGVIACQDCGAAGLLSSTSEMAYKGGCSLELDLDKLHLANKNMNAAQILLSETQERMVFALEKKTLKKVFDIAKKYELEISHIGKTFRGGDYIVKKEGKILSKTPLEVLCNPFYYNLEPIVIKKPKNEICKEDLDIESAVEKLIKSPEFDSKEWFYEQWDYGVGGRTYLPPGLSGAGALKLPCNKGFIGLCMDTKPRFSEIEPYSGACSTFLESYRNLVSSGFEPLGFTNCLNFANPENNDTKYSFVRSIEGLRDISKAFDIPVVSGNVSFYNECAAHRVYPSVTLGMLGFCPDENNLIKARFYENNEIYIIGKKITKESNTGGSLYQSVFFDFISGMPDKYDIELEKRLKKTIFELISQNKITGAKDVSKGGVLGSLLCMAFDSNIGFSAKLLNEKTNNNSQKLKLLFGEIEGRYIIATDEGEYVEKYLQKNNIEYYRAGKCFGDKIEFDGYCFDLVKLRNIYKNSIKNALGE